MGGEERQDKPVDIVGSLLNARLHDGLSVDYVDNAAEADIGPSNDLSQGLGIIRRNNLEVYLMQVSVPISLSNCASCIF